MTLAELRLLAAAAGFPDPNLAAAVAMAESAGNPCARGDPSIGPDCADPGTATSFGLWQIHVPAHPQYDPVSLFDPHYNAAAAFAISDGGRDWSPWSTFNHRLYTQFLPGAAVVAAPGAIAALAFALGAVWIRSLRSPLF